MTKTNKKHHTLPSAFKIILEHHLSNYNRTSKFPISISSVQTETVLRISEEIENWDSYQINAGGKDVYVETKLYCDLIHILLGGNSESETNMIEEYEAVYFIHGMMKFHLYDLHIKLSSEPDDVILGNWHSIFHRDHIKEINDKYNERLIKNEVEKVDFNSFSAPHYQIKVHLSFANKSYKMIYFIPKKNISEPINLDLDNSFTISLFQILRSAIRQFKNNEYKHLYKLKTKYLYDLIGKWETQTIVYILKFMPQVKTSEFLELCLLDKRESLEKLLHICYKPSRIFFPNYCSYIDRKIYDKLHNTN